MSYSPTLDSFDTDRDGLRRKIVPIAAAVLVAAIALTAYGAHDMGEILVVTAVILATTAGVYGLLLPRKLRQESAGGTSLTMSLVGLALLLPAFWSGLPLVLGVAGAILGYAGRKATKGAGMSQAGFAIGVLSSVGYFAVYVLDALNQAGIG